MTQCHILRSRPNGIINFLQCSSSPSSFPPLSPLLLSRRLKMSANVTTTTAALFRQSNRVFNCHFIIRGGSSSRHVSKMYHPHFFQSVAATTTTSSLRHHYGIIPTVISSHPRSTAQHPKGSSSQQQIRTLSFFENSSSDNLSKIPQQVNSTPPPWHDPSFMKNATPFKKDEWLTSLLSSSSNIAHDSNNMSLSSSSLSPYDDDGNGGMNSPPPIIDVLAFNIVLKGWSQSSSRMAPQKTEEWIGRLERYGRDGVEPNIASYNAVIEAWSKSHDPIGIIRAERWFNKLKDTTTSTHHLQPNTQSYNHFLSALSRDRRRCKNKQQTAYRNALRCEEILSQMSHPNTESYNIVMFAWTKCRGYYYSSREDDEYYYSVTDRVMRLLKQMERMQRENAARNDDDDDDSSSAGAAAAEVVRPNTKSYSIAMTAWGLAADGKVREMLRRRKKRLWDAQRRQRRNDSNETTSPNDDASSSFNDRQVGFSDVNHAESILNYMHDLENTGYDNVAPDTTAYNTLLSLWSRVSNDVNTEAPLRAESVLRRMIYLCDEEGNKNVVPDHRSYTMVMNAWTNTHRPNATPRANHWLEQMWTRHHLTSNPRVKPTIASYNVLFQSLLSRPTELQNIVVKLLEKEVVDNHPKILADTTTFSLVIKSWTRYETSRECLAANAAGMGLRNASYWLFELMKREDDRSAANSHRNNNNCSTSRELYNSILQCAVRSHSSSGEVYDIAKRVFDAMRASRFGADEMSYVLLLQVGLKSTFGEDERRRRSLLVELIRTCSEDDGLLCGEVIRCVTKSDVVVVPRRGGDDKEAVSETEGDRERLVRWLFSDDGVGGWPFPKTWSRNVNVREGFRPPVERDLRREWRRRGGYSDGRGEQRWRQ